MAIKQIPGVAPLEITKEDLDDKNLSRLNQHLRELSTTSNILAGAHGTIPITVPIDMQGNNLLNAKAAGARLTAPAPVAASGEVALGNGTAATASTGGGQPIPGKVAGYLVINVGGVSFKVPYFPV